MIKPYYIAIASLLFFGCQKIEVVRITKVFTEEAEVNSSSVSIDGVVVDVSNAGVSKYGHCWSTNSNPTLDNFKTVFDSATVGTYYTSTLTNLQFNTTYYVRSYTQAEDEIVYGENQTFIIDNYSYFELIANSLTILGENEINIEGVINGAQSLTLQDHGVCYKLDSIPTINDEVYSMGNLSQNISLNSSFNNLLQERHYKFRLFAQLDSNTTLYSNVLSSYITDLHVSTHNNYITADSVIFSGAIDSLGVLDVTDHGHCWSYLTSNPTINSERISLGQTITDGVYLSSTTNLNNLSNITVYYRAYAIKESEIVYGEVKSFDL
jgi:hypothetical protein